MPSEAYRLSEYNGSFKSDTSLTPEHRPSDADGKMYVSPAKAFILAFLAIAVAVGVGIIVHFAGDRTVECNCQWPGSAGNDGGSAAALDQCKTWAQEGNDAICKYCFRLVIMSACLM